MKNSIKRWCRDAISNAIVDEEADDFRGNWDMPIRAVANLSISGSPFVLDMSVEIIEDWDDVLEDHAAALEAIDEDGSA